MEEVVLKTMLFMLLSMIFLSVPETLMLIMKDPANVELVRWSYIPMIAAVWAFCYLVLDLNFQENDSYENNQGGGRRGDGLHGRENAKNAP